MENRTRWIAPAAVAALGAVLLAGLWAFVAAPIGQVARLPDGSTLTLDNSSYGRAHPYVHGSRWQKWLYPLVPPGTRDWSGWWTPAAGWTAGTFFSRSPSSLVLQARRHGTTRGRLSGTAAVAVDSGGAEFAPGLGAPGDLFPVPAGVDEVWELPVFPRRRKTVRVRVYDQRSAGEWARVAEFVVPNPTPGPYPTWKAEPLPVTSHAGDLAVTLTRLTTGVIPEDPYHRSAPGDDRWTRADFQVRRRGVPTSQWKPATVTISDATGNTWSHRNQDRTVGEETTRLEFPGTLPRGEATWKLRVQFLQRSGFSPDDLWRVSGVPFPEPNQPPRIIASGRRMGVRLSLTATGRGRSRGPGGFQLPPFPALDLATSPAAGLTVELIRATDDRGRVLHPFSVDPQSTGSGHHRFYLEPTLAGPGRLNLLFALQHPRVMQFLVAPPR